jgi:hypothetical protein
VKVPQQPRGSSAAESLLDRLRTAENGRLRVEDPSGDMRASYRSAISAAITEGLVPAGQKLRHTGRDRGDMEIWLEQAPAAAKPAARVPLPETTGQRVKEFAAASALNVSAEALPRALLLLQALADEAGRHGYRLENDDGSCAFVLGEDRVPFVLFEEEEAVDRVPNDELQAAKYDWQRVRPRRMTVPSGRLRLELRLPRRWQQPWWADRKRWSLADKLGEVLLTVESEAATARDARERKRLDAENRRREWEEAVPRARQAYIEDLNRQRLAQQLADAHKAVDLREYSQSVGDSRWGDWIRSEADRLDPLLHPEGLKFVEPEMLPRDEVDKYMPPGMTSAHPPADDASVGE